MKVKRRFLVALAGVLAIAGCQSSDDATAPLSSSTLDLSSLLSEMAAGSANIPSSLGVAGFAVPVVPPVVPSSCQYSASIQGFTCGTLASNGVTFGATLFLLDAAGNFQTQPDAATTAAIRTVTDMTGTTKLEQSGSGSLSLTSHQDMTLSGLLSGTHVINGTGTSHTDITLTAPTAMHAVTDQKSVTANVTVPKAGSATRWPTSGTITTDATTTSQSGSQSITGTVHSVLTFNGSSTATTTTTITSGSS